MPPSVLDLPFPPSSAPRPAARAQAPARADADSPRTRFEIAGDSASSGPGPRPAANAPRGVGRQDARVARREESKASGGKDAAAHPPGTAEQTRDGVAGGQIPESDIAEATQKVSQALAEAVSTPDAAGRPPVAPIAGDAETARSETVATPEPVPQAIPMPDVALVVAEGAPEAASESAVTAPRKTAGQDNGPEKAEDVAGPADNGRDPEQADVVVIPMPLAPVIAMAAPAKPEASVPEAGRARPRPVAAMAAPPRQSLGAEQGPSAPVSGDAHDPAVKDAARPALEQGAAPNFSDHLAKAGLDAAQPPAGQAAGLNPAGLPVPPPALPPQPGGLHMAGAAQGPQASGSHPVIDGVPVAAVPVEIGLKSLAGINRFDIRLAPDDLGRIEVRLDISDEGRVKAHIVVERPDALASLQRETPQLERALSQAGLSSGQDGISMSLRQQGHDGAGGRGQGAEPRPGASAARRDETEAPAAPIMRRYSASRASGIDRHV